MASNRKIKDSDLEVSRGSRADRYWLDRGFRDLYRRFRSPGMDPPPGDPYVTIRSKFAVKAIEFGNWVPIDIRYNYLVASIVASADIRRATRLRSFGFRVLSLAYGARGAGRALAHYEPMTLTINITRYPDDRGRAGFAYSGGVGSLAHEYGHFLDYYFGPKVKNRSGSVALSGGHHTVTRFSHEELADPGPWGMMSRVLHSIIWQDEERKTPYYERVKEVAKTNDYWYRRNELFARAFEQYVQVKLQGLRISNTFLTKGHKYDDIGDYYMHEGELARITPLMDRLMGSLKGVR